MATRMQITTLEYDGRTIVRAAGEVDMADSGHLTAAIVDAATPGTALIVDLSTVEFMDSAGLQGVLHANHDAKAHGTPLVLVPSPAVTRLFNLSGADRTLTLSPDLPHALTTAQAAKTHPHDT